MGLAAIASVVPPIYTLYLFGWRGLRALAPPPPLATAAVAIAYLVLGVWLLRSWMKIVELERLARAMILDFDEEGGAV